MDPRNVSMKRLMQKVSYKQKSMLIDELRRFPKLLMERKLTDADFKRLRIVAKTLNSDENGAWKVALEWNDVILFLILFLFLIFITNCIIK